jgi:hypothetical protein
MLDCQVKLIPQSKYTPEQTGHKLCKYVSNCSSHEKKLLTLGLSSPYCVNGLGAKHGRKSLVKKHVLSGGGSFGPDSAL